eukprot:scaffold12297_cov56-Attheya_sp.AAC.1
MAQAFLVTHSSNSKPIMRMSQDRNRKRIASLAGDDDEELQEEEGVVRFLGKGAHAVVREGVVLVAPSHEYNHFLMRSAVFVHGIGINDYGEHVTRGVIIDHPTAFTMGEMGGGTITGVLAHNMLFQGGDNGNDSCILLHPYGNHAIFQGEQESQQPMIGTSGIYEGGITKLMDEADEGNIDPNGCKFFFNFVEFTDSELASLLESEDSDGDAWASVEAPPSIILDNDWNRGDAWSRIRNKIRTHLRNNP